MIAFLLRRLAQSILTLVIISLLVFTALFAIGDPVAALLPPTATVRDREILRRDLGLDRSLPVQYAAFIGRLARGDLGTSYYRGRPVTELMIERAPATFELAVFSLMISVLVGIPLGIFAGARPRSWFSHVVMGGSMFGISLPTFWLGLMLMMYFGVHLDWLPTRGRGETRLIGSVEWSFLTRDGWAHMIMPAVTLSFYYLAMLIRLVRSELLETLEMPFIRVARSRGLSEASVIGRHAMRNSLIPVVTVVGVQFGQLLAFSVITETIFQWPGLGKLLIDSIYELDRPLVVAYMLLTGFVFLALNFGVDMTYALIDPRIRLSRPKSEAPH